MPVAFEKTSRFFAVPRRCCMLRVCLPHQHGSVANYTNYTTNHYYYYLLHEPLDTINELSLKNAEKSNYKKIRVEKKERCCREVAKDRRF